VTINNPFEGRLQPLPTRLERLGFGQAFAPAGPAFFRCPDPGGSSAIPSAGTDAVEGWWP
jgi:hypothetical protein